MGPPPALCEYCFELAAPPASCPTDVASHIVGGIRCGGKTEGYLQAWLVQPAHAAPNFRVVCAGLDRKLLECATQVCDQNGRLRRNWRLQHDHRGGFLCITAIGLHPHAKGRGRAALTGAVLALLSELRGHVEVCCVERKSLDHLGQPVSEDEWAEVDFQTADGGEGHWLVMCAQ